MNLKQLKSNPTQLFMFGILILFVGIIVVWSMVELFSGGSSENELAMTATQAFVNTHRAGTQLSGDGPNITGTVAAITDSNTAGLPSVRTPTPQPGNASTLSPGTLTVIATQSPPAGGSPPPGITPPSLNQGTSTSSGPPSDTTPPLGSQVTQTGNQPPSGGTPPPTLQGMPTYNRPPSGGSPPPTLQQTPTEPGPPSGGSPPP